ncbi:transposase [Accumulibacter sp.]|uniref:transposase n=1 Tax=Accumulibacter sp. TaxID=2053492 RepID=UPI002615678F|nr:transposase [Accumulibacter sp.]
MAIDAAEHLPDAAVCFDRCHVAALSSTALGEVRRAEVKTDPEVKGTRLRAARESRRRDDCTESEHSRAAGSGSVSRRSSRASFRRRYVS